MRTGMNRESGAGISDLAHIRQSIRDILTTRIGTRVMRRDYGSLVPELIDQPFNGATQLKLMAATIMAIIRWEPRVIVKKIEISLDADGKTILDMQAERRDGPRSGTSYNLSIAVT